MEVIVVDDREKESAFLSYLPHGLVTINRLEFGDISFIGGGPRGEPTLIGVERKSIGDLINSITSGRFAGHQLEGLINSYGVVYLLVEGIYRAGDTGLLETMHGRGNWETMERGRRWMYSDVECWLTTMEQMVGVHIRRAASPRDTAAVITSLYQWWNGKEYEEHRAHLTMHRPPDAALLKRASLVRIIAAELPGIGWTKSQRVEHRFRSVAEMVEADEKDWMGIEGVGRKIAGDIVRAIWGSDVERMKARRP